MHLVYLMINVWLGCSRQERECDPHYMYLATTHCGALAKFHSHTKFCFVSDLALATLWMPVDYSQVGDVSVLHAQPRDGLLAHLHRWSINQSRSGGWQDKKKNEKGDEQGSPYLRWSSFFFVIDDGVVVLGQAKEEAIGAADPVAEGLDGGRNPRRASRGRC
jgi:hypothetical protein